MNYLRLFFEFFKTGLFAFGGGMATIPFLAEMGERTGWFTREFLTDIIAVSESTPGPIAVNAATYVGYNTAGIPGGIVATLGLIAPSLILVMIIATFLKAFRSNRYVEQVFYGIRPASVGLIAAAGITVMRLCLVDTEAFRESGKLFDLLDWRAIVLFAVIWLLTNLIRKTEKLHPVFFIAGAAVVGIVFRFAGA